MDLQFKNDAEIEHHLVNVSQTVDAFSGMDVDEMDELDREILGNAFRFRNELVGELKSRRKMSVVRRVLENR